MRKFLISHPPLDLFSTLENSFACYSRVSLYGGHQLLQDKHRFSWTNNVKLEAVTFSSCEKMNFLSFKNLFHPA